MFHFKLHEGVPHPVATSKGLHNMYLFSGEGHHYIGLTCTTREFVLMQSCFPFCSLPLHLKTLHVQPLQLEFTLNYCQRQLKPKWRERETTTAPFNFWQAPIDSLSAAMALFSTRCPQQSGCLSYTFKRDHRCMSRICLWTHIAKWKRVVQAGFCMKKGSHTQKAGDTPHDAKYVGKSFSKILQCINSQDTPEWEREVEGRIQKYNIKEWGGGRQAQASVLLMWNTQETYSLLLSWCVHDFLLAFINFPMHEWALC